MRVFLVEDDAIAARGIALMLRSGGPVVDRARRITNSNRARRSGVRSWLCSRLSKRRGDSAPGFAGRC
jgi:hypothetical protein